MRKTGPVTQVEINLTDSDQLVSSTDTKGVITSANDVFCRLAGFSKEELIGQAHNLVRHSDMPQAAFSLLWGTIQQGKPWRGIVKNRCENGDHYWVDAYVTPMYEDNKIVGYESVRQKADPAWIKRADEVYTALNNGKNPLPLYKRLVEKHMYLFKAGSLGLLGLLISLVFSGASGLLPGTLILGIALLSPLIFSTQALVDKQLE